MSERRGTGGDIATVVDANATRGQELEPKSFVLTVTAGPDKGASFVFDHTVPARVLVGQGPACALRLSDPQVSRRHAAFERVGAALRITDCDSTNGTYVDRVRVLAADLSGGEFVRLGSTLLHVDVRADADAVEAPVAAAFGRLAGSSLEMRRLYPLFARLAESIVPVVLEGETGTGKEVLAEALHEQGPRADRPFIVFDCTACPPNLVESELFGHERGAFTGAVSQRRGVFEQAHTGTLLIDEIGDLDLPLQAKLLRAIERSEVRRVGGDAWLKVNVRILAATRRNLDKEVEAGRFRDDLFHRLAVARVELPPLRQRRGDVTTLANLFWHQLGGQLPVPSSLLERWEASSWPGNVRELRNSVARQLALGDLAAFMPSGSVAPPPSSSSSPVSYAPSALSAPAGDVIAEAIASGLAYPQARDRVLETFDERFVEHLLGVHGGNVTRAAAASGIGRRYFQKIRARQGR
jgi:DNA-binding NtrC family response regulator